LFYNYNYTPKGRTIFGGSVERQFSPDVNISRARTALCSPSPFLPQLSAPLLSAKLS